jgi:glycerol-3-phosphate dehydrogenase (NAD(P)+)
VPSQAVRPALTTILPFLKKKTIVVAVSKGIEQKTNKFIPEVVDELVPVCQPFVFCGGPMLSEEIIKGEHGIAVMASRSLAVFKRLEKMFEGSAICLEYNKDVLGVAVSGVLKNIYVIALGIANGLGWGANAQAWLVTQCLSEMKDLAVGFGVEAKTVYSTAGLGDLIATGFSPYSKNRESGRLLAETGKCCFVGEGAVSFPSILKKLGSQIKKYPVLSALEKVLIKKQHAKKVFQGLID